MPISISWSFRSNNVVILFIFHSLNFKIPLTKKKRNLKILNVRLIVYRFRKWFSDYKMLKYLKNLQLVLLTGRGHPTVCSILPGLWTSGLTDQSSLIPMPYVWGSLAAFRLNLKLKKAVFKTHLMPKLNPLMTTNNNSFLVGS